MNLTPFEKTRNPARPADEHMSVMPKWERSMNAVPEELPAELIAATMPTLPDPAPVAIDTSITVAEITTNDECGQPVKTTPTQDELPNADL